MLEFAYGKRYEDQNNEIVLRAIVSLVKDAEIQLQSDDLLLWQTVLLNNQYTKISRITYLIDFLDICNKLKIFLLNRDISK